MNHYPLDEKAMFADLRGLLQIESTNHNCGPVTEEMPLGEGVYRALQYVENRAKELGFRTKMLDGYSLWVEAGQGDRLVANLCHVDTVPVEKEGWAANPYDATLLDGKVYGRGICDDKGPTILSLYALKALVDAGKLTDKRVRLIVGGDEESGAWTCMKRYRQTEEIPECAFSPDGSYPATYAERGVFHITVSRKLDSTIKPLTLEGGKTYNIVPAYATAMVDGKTYEAQGKAAHASRPELGINATRELCKQLAADGVDHPFVRLMEMADPKGWGIDFEDEPSGKLTLNPAISVVNSDFAQVQCDLRVPVTFTPEQVVQAIQQKVSPLGFDVVCDFVLPSLYVPKDSPLVQTLQKVYQDCTGRQEEPIAVGGGTYARTFENAVAFGPLLPGEENSNHKTNERWDYQNMLLTYKILANVMELL